MYTLLLLLLVVVLVVVVVVVLIVVVVVYLSLALQGMIEQIFVKFYFEKSLWRPMLKQTLNCDSGSMFLLHLLLLLLLYFAQTSPRRLIYVETALNVRVAFVSFSSGNFVIFGN